MPRRNVYPTKTTLNLAIRERRKEDLRLLLLCAAAGAVLIALFCRFGVIGRLRRAAAAEQAAAQAEQALADAQEALEDYDRVEAAYSRYFSEALVSQDIPQPCMDVLDMMEKELMGSALVTSCSFSGGKLLLQLKVSRLGVTSELMEKLYRVPMVDTVSISTATDNLRDSGEEPEEAGASVVVMTIALREVEGA